MGGGVRDKQPFLRIGLSLKANFIKLLLKLDIQPIKVCT